MSGALQAVFQNQRSFSKPSPSLVSSSTFDTNTASNTFTITKPTSITSGNLLVCFISKIDNTGDPSSVPSGWTRAGSGSTLAYIYYKTATGSEPADYTWSGFPNNQPVSVIIQNWINVTFDSSTTTQNFKNSPTYGNPTPTLGPLTSPAANSVLVFMVANEDPNSGFNTPSGFTAESPLGTAHKSSLFLFVKTGVAAGSTGVITSTPSVTNSGEVRAQMVLFAN